ncbi:MAG: ComEC/Rec2 family competence protein [Sporomusaceae bacterium]|nr:ComEC/Rec2 family competence protein [Sporomusaceae bacterium]
MRNWRMSTLLVGLMLLVSLLTGACGSRQTAGVEGAGQQSNPSRLVVQVLDVGQADAILIRTPRENILIDTGDAATKDKVVSYIKSQGITSLDKVIITHAHADHLGGMTAVIENIAVRQIYDSAFPATTATYRNYLTLVKKRQIPFARLRAGDQVDLGGGAELRILAPEKEFIKGSNSDVNNSSIVARLSYGDFSMLLTGDAESESEAIMVKRFGSALKSRVLKSPHHGSRTSSSPAFLKAVAPETVVISTGAGNEYGHPHAAVMKRYQNAKLTVYRTDHDGTVTISSDGKTYTVTKEKGR